MCKNLLIIYFHVLPSKLFYCFHSFYSHILLTHMYFYCSGLNSQYLNNKKQFLHIYQYSYPFVFFVTSCRQICHLIAFSTLRRTYLNFLFAFKVCWWWILSTFLCLKLYFIFILTDMFACYRILDWLIFLSEL